MVEQSSLKPHEILAAVGVLDVSDIEPVNAGTATAVWQVLWIDGYYALRVFQPEQVKVAKREVAAMNAASAAGITVPDIVREGMCQDHPVLLLSWLPGVPLFEYLQEYPDRVDSLGAEWGGLQAALHRVPAPNTFDANDWIEWAGDEPELKGRLREINPLHPRLLHLDLHPMNVMVDDDRISGMIDWANARAGDPRADFARTCCMLRFANVDPDSDLSASREFLARLERAWHRGYQDGGGKTDDMALFHAWAGAAMLRDLAPVVDDPDAALQDADLAPIRDWRDTWKQRAGMGG